MAAMDYFFLFLFALLAWFWLDSLRAGELAREAGRRACISADVQFLDDTVSISSLSLSRYSGRLALVRTYRFEFSDTGDRRLDGEVTLKGHRLESVRMDPYLVIH